MERLSVESLLAEAQQQASADQLPPPASLDGLRKLLDALDTEADLTPAGRRTVRAALVSALSMQLRADQLLRRHPEIGSIPIDRPIFITGLHRSGTTLLHRLLTQHPQLRAPALWELLAPADDGDVADLVARAQAYVDEYYAAAPALPGIHFLDARQPDECHRLLAPTFRSEIFELRYRVPSYGRWLADEDMTLPYAFHRTLLRCILFRSPAPRLVLKCPFHLWHPDALAAVYPDAYAVRLHRNPRQTVPSACSLTATIRAARSASVNRFEIGRHWMACTARVVGSIGDRTWGGARGLAVCDVRYRDLVRDPLTVASQVCEFVGAPLTDAARDRMLAYLRANPSDRHGQHRYGPGDFGLDLAELDRQFAG